MPIDVQKFGEAIVKEFLKEYNNDIANDQLAMNALRTAADAAAIAIKLYEEGKTE